MSRAATAHITSRLAWLGRALDWLFSPTRTPGHWLFLAVVLAASLALQWQVGQGFARQTNQDMNASDQLAYLRLIERNAPAWWPMVIDGTRNPLFPWLLKPWLTPDRAQLFASAKSVNIAFGMVASAVLGGCFLLRLPLLPAIVLSLLGTYAVILPASTFVGAEVVFYLAFFFLWVCLWRILTHGRLRSYAAGGFVCALAYLAKPSTQLLALVFCLLSLAGLSQGFSAHKVRRLLAGGGLFLGCFLLPVLPRAWQAWQEYGDPLQSCSAYCFWTDNWDEAQPRLGYYSKRRIAGLPEPERPSLTHYWQQHTLAQMLTRLRDGVPVQTQNFFLPEKTFKLNRRPAKLTRLLLFARGAYPVALLCLTFVLAIATRSAAEPPELRRSRRALWWLAGLGFAVHFLAFAFYTPVAPGARFIMAMYLPVIFALAAGVESLRSLRTHPWQEALYRLAYLGLAAALLGQIAPLTHATAFGEVRGAF